MRPAQSSHACMLLRHAFAAHRRMCWVVNMVSRPVLSAWLGTEGVRPCGPRSLPPVGPSCSKFI